MPVREAFVRGVEALIRRLHPEGTSLALAAALAEFAAALAVVDCPDSHDLEDMSSGSVTRADALRIRASKFVVSQLPPGMFAEVAVRRTIRAEVKQLVEAELGELRPSAYLDAAARDD